MRDFIVYNFIFIDNEDNQDYINFKTVSEINYICIVTANATK